jgi:hypothetical protein
MEECASNLEEIVRETTVESVIDSLITANGSMEESQDKIVTKGFSYQEGVEP